MREGTDRCEDTHSYGHSGAQAFSVCMGFSHYGVPVVLEQKTTILWKYLYLLVSLQDSLGLGEAYETNRRGGEENPVHGRNTTVNVDKIRGFRPPYVWTKPFGYCWRIYFKVLAVPFFAYVFQAFLPSKMACGIHNFRHF
jgi:hypothetical protein